MKWLKRLRNLIGVIVLVAVGGAAFLELRSPKMRPVDPNKKLEATPARIERGRYIVTAQASCLLCHSEHDWKTHGAPPLPGTTGGGWDVPWAENKMPGKVFASNITPDPDTGLGKVPDDAIARAIREGVGRDGRALFMMPPYSGLSDEEVASVVAYLRTLAPVKKQRELTHINIPVRWFLKALPKPITTPVPEPDLSDPVARGRHLADIGRCEECHTPVDGRHQPLPGMAYSGGQEFRGPWGLTRSSNITPHASGIAHYSEDVFVRTMRTGNIGGRRIGSLMPWTSLRNMTDQDLKALWAYLKTVPPVAHDVPREPVEVAANPAIDEHPAVAAVPPP
jgi:mono/diheme cytochrome c family protein